MARKHVSLPLIIKTFKHRCIPLTFLSLTSRLMEPVKALGRAGILGNFLNNFDGSVEVLDDLDDHWTAKNHKEERRFVVEDLQAPS